MQTQRLDVRLDAERCRRLREIAQEYKMPISEVVRKLIDDAHEKSMLERRMRAAIELGQMEIEDVPDPDELSRQLEATHGLGELY